MKVRRTLIGESRRNLVYDDLEASEKVKIYDTGAQHGHPVHLRAEASA